MKRIVFVLILVLILSSFSFANDFASPSDKNSVVNNRLVNFNGLKPFIVKGIPIIPIHNNSHMFNFWTDRDSEIKAVLNETKYNQSSKIQNSNKAAVKVSKDCPISYVETEENKIFDVHSVMSYDTEYFENLGLDIPIGVYEYDDIKLEFEQISFDEFKISANVLKIFEADNANGLDFNTDSDWEEFIDLIDKRKVSSRSLFNEIGDEIGFANIYQNDVDGFSNEIHVYTEDENRFIKLYWSEFSK